MQILERFWVVECYPVSGDKLAWSQKLEGVTDDMVRMWFNESPDTPLLGGIVVREEQVGYLQPFVRDVINLREYEYIVEEQAVYDWSKK